MGGKMESTKVIRIWILGATICATIFLALSLNYDVWAIKTYVDKNVENYEKTFYFGLWNKCEDEREGNKKGEPMKPMTVKCEGWKEQGPGILNSFQDFLRLYFI